MPNALVTGAAGFTGCYMVRALERAGFRVFRVGLVEALIDEDWIQCDLTDKASVTNAVKVCSPDVVVHLAALSFVADTHAFDFYRVNVFGTLNLLEAVGGAARSPSKVLVASSANVYGNRPLSSLDEDTCPAPINHYGASKLAMESLVRTWFNRIPLIITRPFNYTGPGQDDRFLIPKIVKHYQRYERSITLGNINVERDFSDVEDVVECYLRLLSSSVDSQIVNICTGRSVTVAEIIAMMNEIAGYEICVESQSNLVRANEIQRLLGSNEKLRSMIGFVPVTPLRQTLQRMYTG